VSSTFARAGRRAALPALLGALAVLLAGCGAGAGSAPSETRLTVTQDFGSRAQRDLAAPKVSGSETVMRLLQRNAKITTRFGGGFVQSIDGVAGGRRDGRPFDWFYYVNGVEASEGAAAVRLHPGDRVWWDRHDWGAAMRVPAVVGSFPEPFVHGFGGRRLPVRVECADPSTTACDEVFKTLSALGVPAAKGGLRTAQTEQTLRVVVGPWIAARDELALRPLEAGPARSGVYARPAPDGRSIRALDARGRATRTLGPGTGLVAAAREGDEPPVWAVTGTDGAGVDAAARAFTERTLGRRFAVAVVGGRPVPLPEAPAS
jgi:Domain of unknown function (DUF4430)